ncbi:hypothetical protein K435DRAFT_959584 [Dendrothele bispora CBS 962.96]|uniref:Ig-like domain-containing protein n=1 Tax=Dendrothele bispora (strain CBS 962.96) TaxID=1314807 RepID=A0A4S8MWS1_DENBC|nr:hypothetical protein K435DRAFT_959584 [Dendrothele bispora CBS 962.96]
MSAKSVGKRPETNAATPLVPDEYLDVPSQRLYSISIGALCQAVKLIDYLRSFVEGGDDRLYLCRKWLFVDFTYCIVLSLLRIPRLNYSKAVVALQIIFLWVFDGLLFGGIQINIGGSMDNVLSLGTSRQAEVAYTPESSSFLDLVASYSFGLIGAPNQVSNDAHLRGQHTVRMFPISTAQLNPYGETFCLPSTGGSVLIPILLNNTTPTSLRYSVSPLGRGSRDALYFDLSAKELKTIEQARLDALQASRPSPKDVDEYDEYDDDPVTDHSSSSLQTTQALVHVRLSKPGAIRLERVTDKSGTEARLASPYGITVVPCPQARFSAAQDDVNNIRCAGQDPDLQLMMDIAGVPPLSLRWSKAINGRRETFLVEGIEGGHHDDENVNSKTQDSQVMSKNMRSSGTPERLIVPLTTALDHPGSHVYALEEVMDAIGNIVMINNLSNDTLQDSDTTRSFQVLRRPAMSFRHCSPEHPIPLLIGSEAALSVSATDADPLDSPWVVDLKYQPTLDTESGIKRFQPWKKTLTTEGARRELSFGANAPGQYTIMGVKGKFCSGDVLAPETCTVVERPRPTAEIEWKKIHECSGDTGVSASLVMHGTPPFHVYYRVQKDSEPSREVSKRFESSRGHFTLQPEHSGHYTFTFTHISDANYQKVELDGPSIDQIIHPQASAEFVGSSRNKKKDISICEGSMINADVELRGSGPWNLEVQIVGPKSSEIVKFDSIENARKTLQIPVPTKINQDGGSFEVDLVNIEDKYGCKRALSTPGVTVNVRRSKPTVKFYGAEGKRNVTVLEREQASLPLRLTGQAPWRLKYRRIGEPRVSSVTLNSPNDVLHATESGIYEILDISDAQCPGYVVADASTYQVDWIPRPTARLSSQTQATYEPLNGSYILPPICAGNDGHVDLDLTGRPPFQIMYNIAQDNENGGSRLLDQPVFNSIQPRTRLQLLTSNPGRIYYEVKQIGDAAYPLAKYKNTPIPRSDRLLFEQLVSMRPSARFRNRNRLSYCLNDLFTPLDTSSDGSLVFEGTPPFLVELSIKNVATSHIEKKVFEVMDHAWKVDLPSYEFKSIGPHLVIIESVEDASGCAHAALDPVASSIWVDVAETAAIVPFDRREDYCVGDVTQFQLEGIPPWSIEYRINGKSYTQEAKASPLSLLQKQPGEFTITSIAHQQKMCKNSITDLRFNVHALPSAEVAHGIPDITNIHEGEQAEIIFTLIGQPPFTFTYQRSELGSGKQGKPKILETHTVSRVFSNEYSIFSALEGIWTVTSISDRYCRYPPQPDMAVEKHRY